MDLQEGELALPIKQLDGNYFITNLGRVWSTPIGKLGKHTGKWLIPQIDTAGYFGIRIAERGKRDQRKSFNIHRLIAEHFIPNPENKPCVNHIDGNKLNNSLNNLEWCTQKQNIIHAVETGLIKYRRTTVCCYTEDFSYIRIFQGMRNAERLTGINNNSISACCRGKVPYAGKIDNQKLYWKIIKEI